MHRLSLQAGFWMNNTFFKGGKKYLFEKFCLYRRIDDTNILLNLSGQTMCDERNSA